MLSLAVKSQTECILSEDFFITWKRYPLLHLLRKDGEQIQGLPSHEIDVNHVTMLDNKLLSVLNTRFFLKGEDLVV